MRGAAAGFLVLVAGCAQISGLASLDVDASVDATTDAPFDAPHPDDVMTSDVAQDAGGDAIAMPCSVPTDCDPSKTGDVCCVTLVTTGISPNCTVEAGTFACKAANACATKIGLAGCSTDVVHLCTSSQDCTEPSYPKCCVVSQDAAQPLEVCLSSTIASLLGASCL